jgi:hypothetical protein
MSRFPISWENRVYAMNSYLNLPPEQRGVQQLVDQFNRDENLFRTLTVKRCFRRLSHRGLSPKRQKLLDLVALLSAPPHVDAIGVFRKR